MSGVIQGAYFVAALAFILGLQAMSSPAKARGGIVWAGLGMALAVIVTFFAPGLHLSNIILILIAIVVGGGLAWVSGKRVPMTAMPQMEIGRAHV